MSRKFVRNIFLLIIFLFSPFFSLFAETIRVPTDFQTIKKAISMAQEGDVVEVEDGIYVEGNIILDKKITLKAKNLYGAILDGSMDITKSILIVRAEVEIFGFVLSHAGTGILQRGSPDVDWTAHDLVILDMDNSGISINDREFRKGFANLYNIIVNDSIQAFNTNDARGFNISNCLITNCDVVFGGSNHDVFFVDEISVFNCGILFLEDFNQVKPNNNNEIEFGSDIVILDNSLELERPDDFLDSYNHISRKVKSGVLESIKLDENLKSIAFGIIGEVYFKLGEFELASEWCQRALIIGENLKVSDINVNAYYYLASICEIEGKFLEAVDLYKKSISEIEQLRTQLSLSDHRQRYFKSRMNVYESLINLLVTLHKKDPSRGYHYEAYSFVEKSKAKSFIDSMQESNIDFESRLSPDSRREKNRILEDMAGIQKKLSPLKLTKEKRELLTTELTRANNEYENLLIRIRRDNPDFANLYYPQSLQYSQLKEALLNDETVLIEYFVGNQFSFVFLATTQGLYVARLPKSESLAVLVYNYNLYLNLRDSRQFEGVMGGKRLYDLLIGPIETYLGQFVNKIIIVPDASLNNFPFEALVKDIEPVDHTAEKRPKYFVQDYEISYVASAMQLYAIINRENPRKRSKDLLAVANRKSKDFHLHYNVKEIKKISKLFNKDKTELLINRDATENNFKKLPLMDYKIVHFATHGIINNEDWWRSGFLLYPDDNTKEDGLLQPFDVMNLRINSDLVTLSSCETGKGKNERGEGILGMTRTFLLAGSKSVLCSLWKIEDRATTKFMEIFYDLLVIGKTKAQALRLAKLKMFETKYAHPFYWASFVLVGDSNTPIVI